MLPSETYTNERLDYLGIVAGVCQEIRLASYLDVHAGNRLQQVSIGTATVGMILNGLGWSLRRVYLVPQFFTNKAVEHLLGQGMTAEKLNDDCLRHTLDWLYENEPTTFFAYIAPQVRKMIGIQARHVFLKDQLLLASSLFLKKPGQIIALDLIMVLCLLVCRLAEHRLRVWLTETGKTIPNQINMPTATPTIRLSSFHVLRALSSCVCMLLLSLPQSSYASSHFMCRSWLSWIRLINTSTPSHSQAEECGIHHTNDCFHNVNIPKMQRKRVNVIYA